MRHDIQIFYHPVKPLPIASVQTKVLDRDFSARCSKDDKNFIDEFWTNEVLSKNPNATSTPRGRANLVGTNIDDSQFVFEYVEYKEYLAVANTGGRETKPLSEGVYDSMRIAAVGAALVLPDESVFVHRRPFNATHVAGVFDSSTAGVLPVDARGIYIERGLHEKLKRELGLEPHEVTIEGVTGVHSAGSPDFSGLVTTVLRTSLNKEELERRRKPDIFPEVKYIPQKELADFVIDRYTANDMNHDGAMTLLSSLPYATWKDSIELLQKTGKHISAGGLYDWNGSFAPLFLW